MISKAKWQKYIQKLADIDNRAADLMRQYIEANGLQDESALIDYAYGLATKYGEASGELACEMYDMMAQAQGAMVPPAVPAETATVEEVAKGAMWGKYHSPSQIPSILGRQVRQAGADTMIQNAVRDHAEWAWIPSGDTCAFCITLASRGWQDASRAVLKGNHAEHIHANCDCTFAISFDSKGRRMYDSIYDPDRYKDMYDNAEGSTASDRVNSLRRQMYQQRKDYINAQKRDAYQARILKEVKKNINGHLSTEMYRRKIGDRGREVIDKPTYSKLTKKFVRTGGVIIRGEEAKRHLDSIGKGASYCRGGYYAYIRDDATISEVLEEMYHAQQDRKGMFNEYPDDEIQIRREIDAQHYLISMEKRYKIPIEEQLETRQSLNEYEEDLKALLSWKNKNVQGY